MSSNSSTRRMGRGQQRIPQSRIENDAHGSVTFSKRRASLIKKANEISTLCGVEMLLVILSPSGEAYTFNNPSMDTIAKKYFGDNPTAQTSFAEQHLCAQQEANTQILSSRISKLEMLIQDEMKLNQALCEAEKVRPPISDLPVSELTTMKQRMEMLRSQVLQAMQVHAQAGTAHFERGSILGSSHFLVNDDVCPGGASAL